MRTAHRKAPDYGIYALLELLANFWQNGFLMTSPQEGESENRRVYIGDEWWAWVDLNHRPRAYQYCGPWSRSVILRDTGCGAYLKHNT
jgi:hypothetical protein